MCVAEGQLARRGIGNCRRGWMAMVPEAADQGRGLVPEAAMAPYLTPVAADSLGSGGPSTAPGTVHRDYGIGWL